LTTTIKKEALTLKKGDINESFEEALARSKKVKEKQIDQLLSTIVNVIHDSDTFKQ
jgi:hypothetical protein